MVVIHILVYFGNDIFLFSSVLERLAETRERESEELYRAAYSFYAIEDPGDEDRERLRKAMSWAPQVGAQY